MFGRFLDAVVNTAAAVVSVPLAVIADVAEGTGLVQDTGKDHTMVSLEKVVESVTPSSK